jgi:DNA polymerase
MKGKQMTLGEEILKSLEYNSEYRNIKINTENIIPSGADFVIEKRKNTQNDNVIVSESQTKIYVSSDTGKYMQSSDLKGLEQAISKCKKCPLGSTRKNFVFGTGNPKAKIVVIGEAPGRDEDEQGKPFVGRAGKLLTDILKSINLTREEVFIANILKCRPPDNRNPLPAEIDFCFPYLKKQMQLIDPDYVLAVGTFAGQTILNSRDTLGRMRGKIHTANFFGKDIKVVVTYHPAALLRNPNWKRPTWEDVKLFRDEFEKTLKH